MDNGSTDNTSEIVAKEYKDSVILIRNKTDKSLSHCKSMAIKRSGHEIVAFIDDDCVPCENWPEIIKRSLSDPECDIVADPVRPLDKLKLNNDMIAYHDIIPEKISLKYLIRRSWLEGNHWSLSERSVKILLVRGLASNIVFTPG